ncbi:MAG: xanthine dehydrogenase family protein subunit M [Chloroflexi bacterium]|nr:xanthine dehydrogenase family protein subunit M [Chloroflexota bacterium]
MTTPRSLPEAYALLSSGAYRPIAGGTDLMVQITGELGEPPERVLDVWRLEELRGIQVEDDALVVGALSTYTEIRRSALVGEWLPALAQAAGTIGAAQIQNRGTLGGNIVNASPAGDTLPVLLAADASIIVGSARGEREVAAADFWTGYRETARAADELVVQVRFPLKPARTIRFRKVGTRRAQAISKVVLALAYREDGGVWRDVRVALGSVAATPVRVPETESVLEGAAPRATVADHAAAVIGREIKPIDDVRSTAEYRRAVTGRILHRLLREEGGW